MTPCATPISLLLREVEDCGRAKYATLVKNVLTRRAGVDTRDPVCIEYSRLRQYIIDTWPVSRQNVILGSADSPERKTASIVLSQGRSHTRLNAKRIYKEYLIKEFASPDELYCTLAIHSSTRSSARKWNLKQSDEYHISESKLTLKAESIETMKPVGSDWIIHSVHSTED